MHTYIGKRIKWHHLFIGKILKLSSCTLIDEIGMKTIEMKSKKKN